MANEDVSRKDVEELLRKDPESFRELIRGMLEPSSQQGSAVLRTREGYIGKRLRPEANPVRWDHLNLGPTGGVSSGALHDR